jgi:hypothetical protein
MRSVTNCQFEAPSPPRACRLPAAALVADAKHPLQYFETRDRIGSANLRPALLRLGVVFRSPLEPCPGPLLKPHELFERREPVACAPAWVVTERNPLQRAHVIGKLRLRRLLAGSRLPLDRLGDLREPLVELTRDPVTVVEEIARLTSLVYKPSVIQITIDRIENGYAPRDFAQREPLCGRELEGLKKIGLDFGRSGLNQARRVNAVPSGVRIPRVRGDKILGSPVLIHSRSINRSPDNVA